MNEFTKEEVLDGVDTMYCSKCKEHRPTKKTLSVYSTPEILVIHLKRFSSSGRYTYRSKLEDFVDAPLKSLEISKLIDSDTLTDASYDLFAVSNHFGGLGGGHYTAYCKDPIDGYWYDCDDSKVNRLDEKIITKAAYLLFYRKKTHGPDNFLDSIEKGKLFVQEAMEAEQRKKESKVDDVIVPEFNWDSVPRNETNTAINSKASSLNGSVSSLQVCDRSFETGTGEMVDRSFEMVTDGNVTDEEPISEWPPKRKDDDWSIA
jgi:hypothetical protein